MKDHKRSYTHERPDPVTDAPTEERIKDGLAGIRFAAHAPKGEIRKLFSPECQELARQAVKRLMREPNKDDV